MIISIDHGNKQIKVNSRTFTSGLCVSDTKPPFGKEVLTFNGKFYSLSEERIPYMRDKTVDERYFILTLFAIAFELQTRNYQPGTVEDIQLCVGLPPAHYGTQHEKFQQYFLNRGRLNFQLDGVPYSIFINKVGCYPQAYAATVPMFPEIEHYPKVIVVDIGGFTADYLLIRKGHADLSVCDSLENGVITLYNRIKSKINADFDLLLDESDIDAVLLQKPCCYDANICQVIEAEARLFVEDLLSKLRERMIDLRSGKTVFVGGGSILLRRQIEASHRVLNPIFLDNIAANTQGYELMYLVQDL